MTMSSSSGLVEFGSASITNPPGLDETGMLVIELLAWTCSADSFLITLTFLSGVGFLVCALSFFVLFVTFFSFLLLDLVVTGGVG